MSEFGVPVRNMKLIVAKRYKNLGEKRTDKIRIDKTAINTYEIRQPRGSTQTDTLNS